MIIALGISYFLAYFIVKAFKKHLFKPIILFDIHGVLLKGDFNLEDFTEIPGTRKLIHQLRNKYTVAAFTNMSSELYGFWSKKWDFEGSFDYTFCSGRIGVKKPDEASFKRILRVLGVKAKDVIFFDDVEANVASAKKVGIRGVVFKNPAQAREALEAMGVKAY
mgnify:CR=1 FL=1